MEATKRQLSRALVALVLTFPGCTASDADLDEPEGPTSSAVDTAASEAAQVTARRGGLASTPPMGFNTWNYFGPNYDERVLMEVADAIVTSGMRDVGYRYIGIDDAWQKHKGARTAHPEDLEPDPVKFPHGMKYLADYLHARGLKLGLYSGGDTITCAGYTGSLGHEAQDARTFASWGVDFLKYDSCCNGNFEGGKRPDEAGMRAIQEAMAAALRGSGREVVMSMVNCGWEGVHTWARQSGGHMWRINQDIADMFEGAWPEDYYMPIKAIIDRNSDPVANYRGFAGPGGWNDMDMLVVGLGGKSANASNMPGAGCTDDEYRTHFSMWSMFSSPLLAGNDVRNMDEATRTILTNREVIAIDQDPRGEQARRVRTDGSLEYYVKPLAGGDVAVAMLNAGKEPAMMRISFAADAGLRGRFFYVRDLWRHADLGRHVRGYETSVRSHETVVLRVSRRRPRHR